MNKLSKQKIINLYQTEIQKYQCIFLIRNANLSIYDFYKFREKMNKSQNSIMVIKNTFMKIALTGSKFNDIKRLIHDSIMVIFTNNFIKVIREMNSFQSIKIIDKIICASNKDKFLSKEEISILSKIPSLELIYYKIVSLIENILLQIVVVIDSSKNKLIESLLDLKK